MRRSKWAAGLGLAVCLVLSLAGCGSKTQQSSEPIEGLDQLGDIQVIAREEGSGTRGAFAQLVGFEGNAGKETQSDQTTSDAQIAENAEEIIREVEANTAAIGYVSRGSMTDAAGIKALTVNGSAVDEKSYPLSRSFYLAYSGQLNELETDFLTYIRSAGQDIVGKSYTPVAKASTFLSNQAEGSISIAGSTSVAPLMQELAGAYQQINSHAEITIVETDSTDGLTQAMSGACDLGMSSRDLKDYEQELLDYQIIAQDEIAVVVHEDNPMQDITLDALKQIYTGEICTWNQLNP